MNLKNDEKKCNPGFTCIKFLDVTNNQANNNEEPQDLVNVG
jgi:hypothetical protein